MTGTGRVLMRGITPITYPYLAFMPRGGAANTLAISALRALVYQMSTLMPQATDRIMPTNLLVEDNEFNRDMLSRRLQRRGFEVLMAEDGAQGIEVARMPAIPT